MNPTPPTTTRRRRHHHTTRLLLSMTRRTMPTLARTQSTHYRNRRRNTTRRPRSIKQGTTTSRFRCNDWMDPTRHDKNNLILLLLLPTTIGKTTRTISKDAARYTRKRNATSRRPKCRKRDTPRIRRIQSTRHTSKKRNATSRRARCQKRNQNRPRCTMDMLPGTRHYPSRVEPCGACHQGLVDRLP